MSLAKPVLMGFFMAAFALQGTNPSTGTGRRQVCDVFILSLVGLWLMGFPVTTFAWGAAPPPLARHQVCDLEGGTMEGSGRAPNGLLSTAFV